MPKTVRKEHICNRYVKPYKEGDGNMSKDYADVSAVCFDCARAAGFTPKDKVAGVWVDKCGICNQRKPCTDLWHDWKPEKEGEVK